MENTEIALELLKTYPDIIRRYFHQESESTEQSAENLAKAYLTVLKTLNDGR